MKALATILIVLILTALGPELHALTPDRAPDQYPMEQLTEKDGLPQNNVEAIAQTADGYLWFALEKSLVRYDGAHMVIFDSRSHPALEHFIIKSMIADENGNLWLGGQAGVRRYRNGTFDTPKAMTALRGAWIRSMAVDSAGNLWLGTRLDGIYRYDGQTLHRFDEATIENQNINKISAGQDGKLWFLSGLNRLGYIEGEKATIVRTLPFNIGTLYADAAGRVWLGTAEKGVFRFEKGQVTPVGEDQSENLEPVVTFGGDGDGNIWFSTLSGSLGRIHENQVHVERDFPEAGSPVQSFFEDREGNLWLAVFGRGLRRLRDSELVVYTERQGLSCSNVSVLHENEKGEILVGTVGGGLHILRSGTFESVELGDSIPPKAFFYTMDETADGHLWLGVYNVGLVGFKDGETTLFTPTDHPALEAIFAIHGTNDGALWIGTWDGLYRYADGEFENLTEKHSLKDKIVRGIHEDGKGRVWVLTSETGIYRYEDGRFHHMGAKEGLSGETMQSITETPSGNIWLTTYGFGINRIDGDRILHITERQGLSSDLTYDVLEDKNRDLWVSTNSGIDFIESAQVEALANGEIQRIKPKHLGIDQGMRTADMNGGTQKNALVSSQGKLYFTTNDGLIEIDPSKKTPPPPPAPVFIEEILVDGIPLKDRREDGPFSVNSGTKSLEVRYIALRFKHAQSIRFRYRLDGMDMDWIQAGGRRAAYYNNLSPGEYTFTVQTKDMEGPWQKPGASVRIRIEPRFHQTIAFKVAVTLLILLLVATVYRLRSKVVLRREREMLERDKMASLGAVTSGIAHEISNPNNYILLNAKLIDQIWKDLGPILEEYRRDNGDFCVGGLYYSESSEEIREIAHGILAGSTRIKKIVETLKQFYKGSPETSFSSVDLNDVVKMAITITEGTIKKATDDFSFTPGFDLPPVRGNAQQLEQVVINLLTNACHALSDPSQPIAVSTTYSPFNGTVTVTVRDSGKGIPEKDLGRIMDPFFTTKRDNGGTGLGLSVSYSIVKNHRGELEFSSSEGTGTTAELILQASERR